MSNPCVEERRFANLEKEVEGLKNDIRGLNAQVVTTQTDQAETKVYVKQIFERIEDLKVLFTSGNSNASKTWQTVVIELIKLVGVVAGIIAGIKFIQ